MKAGYFTDRYRVARQSLQAVMQLFLPVIPLRENRDAPCAAASRMQALVPVCANAETIAIRLAAGKHSRKRMRHAPCWKVAFMPRGGTHARIHYLIVSLCLAGCAQSSPTREDSKPHAAALPPAVGSSVSGRRPRPINSWTMRRCARRTATAA